MADSFFGFDISGSNLNDDEGGGGPSEDEYDALNDETFGHGSDEFDWEMEHEQLAEQLESSRRHNSTLDETAEQLEASLSQLVLDETDAPQSRILGSSVWRNDLPFPAAPTPVPALKNVCTVEELERQLRQKQMQQPQAHQQNQYNAQNYYQPRFPPVILQRPPGLQAPVPLPFAPQQPMGHNMNQIGQPLNKMMNQNNQMGQTNQLMSNHVGQGLNQLGQNVNQLGQSLNQFMQNTNQFQNNQGMLNMSHIQNVHMGQSNHLQNPMGQNVGQSMTLNQMGQNQISQNMMQMGQNTNQMGQNMQLNQNVSMNQNLNQMGQIPLGQNLGQIGQNMPQINQNVPHLSQNMPPISQSMPMSQNQISQNMNQMGQNMNQMGQNVNQMMPNGNQFGQMNQYPHSMGQPRMMAPPPGINMPRQNFSPNMGQYNPNFRPPMKSDQPNLMMNQQMMAKNQLQKPATTSQKAVANKKVEAKPKTRVYNNSNKGLTSQNLVQMIQNTHPILQMNSSYHNASHHPMLNRSMFNNQNHPLLNRQNGNYNSSINGDDCGSDSDEYAGLMTQREKQWLINIQMLQLNTGTPYIHDFYYTVFLERQARKEKEGIKEAHKANQQNHPFYSGAVKQEGPTHRERHNSNRHNSTSEDGSTPRAYVPAQFENSLGKLQCGSVTAPRKIIDVEVVGAEAPVSRAPSRASTTTNTTHAEAPREMKRTKQLLLDIEALYLILLRLEELNDPLAITNALILKEREEKQKQLEAAQKEAENNEEDDSNLFLKNIESVQRRPKQDSPKTESIDKRQVVNLAVSQKPSPVKNLLDEDKDELVNKMFAGLLYGDRLQQMLAVRKGRSLVCRFLRRCGCGGGARVRSVWSRVLRALPSLARRDPAGLHLFAHHYRSYIQATSGWSAIQESCAILAEALDPARTPYVLTTSFTLSAVCALVEKASALVNTPEPSSGERQWFKFLKTLARALKNTTLQIARPLQPLPESKLIQHIKQLESRSTIEILQRGKTADFDMTKAEVSEYLVKNLC